MLAARSEPALDDRQVRTCGFSGAISQLATMLPGVPFSLQQRLVRWTDHTLGRTAQRVAIHRGAAIVSYSYYGYSAFRGAPAHLPRILFQLHPHPASVRAILQRELAAHPDCRASLQKEWELALPEGEYRRLVEETQAAHAWIVASSFTRQTLVENGIPAAKIAVAPYGVDLSWFTPAPNARASSVPLRVLFVGTINQRKGIRYLVEALERLDTSQVHLTVCGRVVDDLAVLRSSRRSIEIRPNVGAEELREQYRAADVFVLPSLAEGFGHVLLEALACGAPVITTTRSAGPGPDPCRSRGFRHRARRQHRPRAHAAVVSRAPRRSRRRCGGKPGHGRKCSPGRHSARRISAIVEQYTGRARATAAV